MRNVSDVDIRKVATARLGKTTGASRSLRSARDMANHPLDGGFDVAK
jgi:hypothetical protein